VGMAAHIWGGLEQRDLVSLVQQMSDGEARDAGPDDGDLHSIRYGSGAAPGSTGACSTASGPIRLQACGQSVGVFLEIIAPSSRRAPRTSTPTCRSHVRTTVRGSPRSKGACAEPQR